MKSKLYYAIPFIVNPIILLLCEIIDNVNLFSMSPFVLGGVILIFSAVMGFYSSTYRTFDYLLTAIMPLSLFCCMFVAGFMDKSDLGTRFHMYRAVDVSLQPAALILYLLMAIVTFFFSFKSVRNIKNLIFD